MGEKKQNSLLVAVEVGVPLAAAGVWRCGPSPPSGPVNADGNVLFFFHTSDNNSPLKGSTRNIKKLEERKMDPLSLEGYGGSTPLPRAPEKGKGGCWAEPGVPGPPRRAKMGARVSLEHRAP